MPNYIINKNEDSKGFNEVHDNTCGHLPASYSQENLGWHSSAKIAVSYAKNNGWPKADGCYYCCTEAHKG